MTYILLIRYPNGRIALSDINYKTRGGAIRGGKARIRRGAESVEIYTNLAEIQLPI